MILPRMGGGVHTCEKEAHKCTWKFEYVHVLLDSADACFSLL